MRRAQATLDYDGRRLVGRLVIKAIWVRTMPDQQWAFVGRKPRHPTVEGQAVEAWFERPAGRLAAVLADFSRHGAGLLTGERVDDGERVVVRIRHAESGLDFSRTGTIRWQRNQSEGCWLVGCEFDEPVSLELLGELFLSEILDANPEPR